MDHAATPVSVLENTDDPGLSPVHSFGFRLWHVQHAWRRRLEAALAPVDLTHMQFVVLRAADHLARQGDQPSQTRLAACIAIDRMMVSKVVRLLDAKGLLVRAVHPEDMRAHHLVLTEAGRRRLAQAIGIVQAEQGRFFGRLGMERQRAFGAMLDDLLAFEGNPAFGAPIVTATTVRGGA